MKAFKLFLIFALLGLSVSSANAQKVNKSVLFNTKYTKGQVWDVQRSPASPIKGKDWKLSNFKTPFDASTRRAIDWGRNNDRYLMFALEIDKYNRSSSLKDPTSGTTYKVTLKLFEKNGTLMKTVSDYGQLIGYGSQGVVYIQKNFFGTFFSTQKFKEGTSVIYNPTINSVREVSDIETYSKSTNIPKSVSHYKSSPRSRSVFASTKSIFHNTRSSAHKAKTQKKSSSGKIKYSAKQTDIEKTSSLFQTKFLKNQVWDVQYPPDWAQKGDWEFIVKGAPFDSETGKTLDWGKNNDRYLMFHLGKGGLSLHSIIDDVNNPKDSDPAKYFNVTLNLYEHNGTFVKLISNCGRLKGFSAEGFLYIQGVSFGTYFSINKRYKGEKFSYHPTVSAIKYTSELLNKDEAAPGFIYSISKPKKSFLTSIDNRKLSSLLKSKFNRSQVWTVNYLPVYPVKDSNWKIFDFRDAYDISFTGEPFMEKDNGAKINWGTNNDSYVKFDIEVDNENHITSVFDNINNSGKKYRIVLKLYDSNGTYISTVSKWGRIIGYGSKGFLYEQEGLLGIFFAAKSVSPSDILMYKPKLIEVTKLSEIRK